jgi:hypothetical protein
MISSQWDHAYGRVELLLSLGRLTLLTKDKARRIAANIAKLPEPLSRKKEGPLVGDP